MATPAIAQPQDLWQARQVFAVIKTLSLVAASGVLLAFKAFPRPVILTHVTLDNMPAFPVGTAMPAGISLQWGTDAAATNMNNSGIGGSAIAPLCLAQRTDLTAQQPYITVNQSLFFAVGAGVAGSGTCDVTFIGAFV